ETAPPPLTIRVCDSLTCEMMGAQQLLTALEDRMGPEVRVVRAPCMGRCEVAPVVEVGHRHAGQATVETVAALAEAREIHPQIPAYRDLASYRAEGGYRLLTQLLDGTRTAESIVEELEASGLRGLGGAGFRTGLKWNLVRRTPAPRLMAVNADEGEPGTFKDRWYLERDPHRFLEGTLIAAAAAECETCWIYLRDEYPQLREVLLREIAAL